MVRRAKTDFNHPRYKARRLVVIADRASENKNNIVFAYCNDLIQNGWLFGPVGHTHNGVDSTHKIHNQNVGAAFSGDIGHYVQNYNHGFTESKPPNATILTKVLDWKKYYDPVMRSKGIIGFKKGSNDTATVRGFRIAKQQTGTIDLCWKRDPAMEDAWRGVGGYANTPGFALMTALPVGVPDSVEEKNEDQAGVTARLRIMLGSTMRATLKEQNMSDCLQFNASAMRTGQVPVHRYCEDVAPMGEWGRLCEIGAVEGKRGMIRELSEFWDTSLPPTRASMWSVPEGPNGEHALATKNIYHVSSDVAMFDSRPLPYIRWGNQSKKDSEVADHPRQDPGQG